MVIRFDRERQIAPERRRQIVVEHVDMDVARHAHAHDGAQEDHDDEAVDGDLLGPGKAVVQDVAREELQEDAERHAPEHGERDPVLHRVARQIDGRAVSSSKACASSSAVTWVWTSSVIGKAPEALGQRANRPGAHRRRACAVDAVT